MRAHLEIAFDLWQATIWLIAGQQRLLVRTIYPIPGAPDFLAEAEEWASKFGMLVDVDHYVVAR